jgi:hypothetical protein
LDLEELLGIGLALSADEDVGGVMLAVIANRQLAYNAGGG